jgi:hypothetical protein
MLAPDVIKAIDVGELSRQLEQDAREIGPHGCNLPRLK